MPLYLTKIHEKVSEKKWNCNKDQHSFILSNRNRSNHLFWTFNNSKLVFFVNSLQVYTVNFRKGFIFANLCTIITNHLMFRSCADSESFARGVPTLTVLCVFFG